MTRGIEAPLFIKEEIVALVLGRKLGESVNIADLINVKVVAVRGNRVRLAIEAPADIRISRSELPPELRGDSVVQRDACEQGEGK